MDLQLRPTAISPLETDACIMHFPRASRIGTREVERLLRETSLKLVVISEGTTYPPIGLLELCVSKDLPFVTISHLSFEHWCPEDPEAERYRNAFGRAVRCYFVSEGNLRLTRSQLGI